MLGLPGDFTPPSRFVRAALFSQALINIKNSDAARRAAFHVLNLFDIPIGIIAASQEDRSTRMNSTALAKSDYDYTQWTSASDLHNKRYYMRTYDNYVIRMVDLTKMNLDAQAPIVIPINQPEQLADLTPHNVPQNK